MDWMVPETGLIALPAELLETPTESTAWTASVIHCTDAPPLLEIRDQGYPSRPLPLAVTLYFCIRLLGLSGIVISINPVLRAGSK